MKVRSGFVSNSSSSSFIIAYKKPFNKESFVKDVLLISEKSPIYNIGYRIISSIIDNSEEMDSLSELIKGGGYSDKEIEEIALLRSKGFELRSGVFSDEEGGLESFLCNEEINIETENFVMRHEGGY